MELVLRRDATMLLPIIQRNVQAGTRIWSDEWGAYNGLNVHETVNHTRHFVDPLTSCHTIDDIKSRWQISAQHSNVQQQMLPSYIDEYMWRCKHPNTFSDLVVAITSQYPV